MRWFPILFAVSLFAQNPGPSLTGAGRGAASITITQQTGSPVTNNVAASCGSSSGTSCTVTTPSATASGDSITLWLAVGTAAASGVSGGCSGTWSHPSSVTTVAEGGTLLDAWWCNNATSGANTVTLTVGSNTAHGVVAYVYHAAGGSTWSVDSGTPNGQAGSQGSGANPVQMAITLSGANDVVFQGLINGSGNAISAITFPYTLTQISSAGNERTVASAITNSGSAPTWTMATCAAAYNSLALTRS